jgi:carboxymethylenebutenolidase
MKMADLLAGSGYNVLAIDLYGEVAVTPERARELSGAVRAKPEEAVRKMQLGVAYLKGKFGEQSKVASLGWCFGGQQSLQLSLKEKLDATVIYYGNLETDPEKLKNISQPVLGVFGTADTSVKIESVRAFEEALKGLNVEQEILVYDGLGHAFANPSGANYAPKETMEAWQKTLAFLEKNLK